MILATMMTVMLAACTSPLTFDPTGTTRPFKLTGPPCSAVRAWLDCACDEGFKWQPSPGAQWYEIRRVVTLPATGSGEVSGTTTINVTRDATGNVGVATRWYFAQDIPFPRRGTTYTYSMRWCLRRSTGATVCSPVWTPVARYKAAPYACWSRPSTTAPPREIPCYPGDELSPR